MGRLIRHQCERNLQYNVLTGERQLTSHLTLSPSWTHTHTHTKAHSYTYVCVHKRNSFSSSNMPAIAFCACNFDMAAVVVVVAAVVLLLLPLPHAILRAHKQRTPCISHPLSGLPYKLCTVSPKSMQHAHFVW